MSQLALTSARGATTAADELDRYYTPDALARACVRVLDQDAWLPPGPLGIVEPSVGGGAFVRAVRSLRPDAEVVGVDVDPEAAGLAAADVAVVRDFREVSLRGVQAVIGNPPFGGPRAPFRKRGDPPYLGAHHVLHALDSRVPLVAMLLPFAWLAVDALGPMLFDERPPYKVYRIKRRPWPGCRDVAWYVWADVWGEHRGQGSVRISRDWIDW